MKSSVTAAQKEADTGLPGSLVRVIPKRSLGPHVVEFFGIISTRLVGWKE